MKELVGVCHVCNKNVYCLDGFLDGFIDDTGKLNCFQCPQNEAADSKSSQKDNYE